MAITLYIPIFGDVMKDKKQAHLRAKRIMSKAMSKMKSSKKC